MNDFDVFEAMQSGNSDRLELKMLIMNHRTFCCPLSGKGLDVDRSVAFEVTEESGSSIFGPFDPSGTMKTRKGDVPVIEFFSEVNRADGVTVRVIKG